MKNEIFCNLKKREMTKKGSIWKNEFESEKSKKRKKKGKNEKGKKQKQSNNNNNKSKSNSKSNQILIPSYHQIENNNKTIIKEQIELK